MLFSYLLDNEIDEMYIRGNRLISFKLNFLMFGIDMFHSYTIIF